MINGRSCENNKVLIHNAQAEIKNSLRALEEARQRLTETLEVIEKIERHSLDKNYFNEDKEFKEE